MTASRHVPHQGTQGPGSADPSSGPAEPGLPGGAGSGSGSAQSLTDARQATAARDRGGGPHDSALLAALLDGMDVALCAFDTEGVVTHWNHEAEKVLGWTAEEAIGHRLTGWAVRQADAEGIQERLREAMASGHRRVHELPLVTKDGRRVLIRAQSAPVRAADGRPTGVYWAFSEVNAQIELERSIAVSEALFNDAPWGVVLVDADLRITVVNAVAARCLRIGGESFLGRPLAQLFRDGVEELEAAVQHVLGEGTPQAPVELWISLRDAGTVNRFCVRSTFLKLGSPLGEEPVPLGVAWLFQDITDAKRSEQEASRLRFHNSQLRRASRVAAECEDPMEAATSYLDFALAGFADHAIIDLWAGEGRLVRVAAAPDDKGVGVTGSGVGLAGIPVGYQESHPALQAVQRTGSVRATAERLAATGGEVREWAAERRWPEDAVHGLCSVLRSRGRTVGVLTFLRGQARRPFDHADAAYAEDVAVRVAAALDLAQQLR